MEPVPVEELIAQLQALPAGSKVTIATNGWGDPALATFDPEFEEYEPIFGPKVAEHKRLKERQAQRLAEYETNEQAKQATAV